MAKKIEKIKLSEFWERFAAYSHRQHAPDTTKLYNLAYRKFMLRVGDLKMNKVTPSTVDQFLSAEAQTGIAAASINNYFRSLKAMFNVAKAWRHINSNPFVEVRALKEEKKRPDFIPPEKIVEFLRGIKDPEKRNFVAALIATGRRRSEMVALRWDDVDLAAKKYQAKMTKIKKLATCAMNDEFHDILVAQKKITGKADRVFPRWKKGTVTHWVKDELRKAGLGHLHLHNCRHTFATMLVMGCGKDEKPTDITTVKSLLFHANINTTMRYVEPTEDHVAKRNNTISLGDFQRQEKKAA